MTNYTNEATPILSHTVENLLLFEGVDPLVIIDALANEIRGLVDFIEFRELDEEDDGVSEHDTFAPVYVGVVEEDADEE